jgi:hypothetical protein
MWNKIKKYTLLFSIILLGVLVHPKISLGQKKIKPDLYIFFQENHSKGMFKESRKDEALIRPEKKKYIPEYEYDIYTYQYTLQDTTRRRRYKLQTLNKNNYCIRDSSFMKRNVKKFEVLKNIHYDIFDHKNFPYSRVFIVEYISANQFKVIQVSTYLGTDY